MISLMDAKKEFSKRFNSAVSELFERQGKKKTQKNVGKFFGVSEIGARHWMQGERLPSMQKAIEIAEKLGVPVEWLMTGKSIGKSSIVEFHSRNYTAIPFYQNNQDSEKQMDNMLFDVSWLTQQDLFVPGICMVIMHGDDMRPRIQDGDLVLVDTRKTAIEDGRIYALDYGPYVKAKRLLCGYDGSLIIRSDNSAYKDEIVPHNARDSLKVIGQAVWLGGEL